MNDRPGPQIACPACRKKGDWFAGKYGPFCSHRCRLIDLGKWLGGEHAISEPLRAEHVEEMMEDKADAPGTID
ncbi:MAG TPA: DNA gyrase inhibitor YacG [Pseudomonadales bacterium]|nr:DNA gyrase inhibitor YacG [Pseudomonadales bacterium]